jgi:hypothetical protein
MPGIFEQMIGVGIQNAHEWKKLDTEALRQQAEQAHFEGQIDVARKQLTLHERQIALGEQELEQKDRILDEQSREFNTNTMYSTAQAKALAQKLKDAGRNELAAIVEGLAQKNQRVSIPALAHFIQGEYALDASGLKMAMKMNQSGGPDSILAEMLRRTVQPALQDRIASDPISAVDERAQAESKFDMRWNASAEKANTPFGLGPAAKFAHKLGALDNVEGKKGDIDPGAVDALAKALDNAGTLYGKATTGTLTGKDYEFFTGEKSESPEGVFPQLTGGSMSSGMLSGFHEAAKQTYNRLMGMIKQGQMGNSSSLERLKIALDKFNGTLNAATPLNERIANDRDQTSLARTFMEIQARGEQKQLDREAKAKNVK